MEKKIQIPEMSTQEILKWYSSIRPISMSTSGPRYLRKLNWVEILSTPFIWLSQDTDFAEEVDYSQLSVLSDVKMLHCFGDGYYGFFKPHVDEVIRQIPKESLNDVCAFELIDGAIAVDSVYSEETSAGYHVSIVRLYKAKGDNDKAATPVNCRPKHCPIGMPEEEFQKLLELWG